jgi:hypothetical protein
MNTLSSKIFVFIAGVEGSGTTMLLTLLDNLDYGVALGGNYFPKIVSATALSLNTLTQTLWKYPRINQIQEREFILQQIRNLPVPNTISHAIYKRSYPFGSSDYYPELNDVLHFASHVKIIIMRRHFKECVFSILRRNFEQDVKKAIERIGEGFEVITYQILKYQNTNLIEINYDDILEPGKKEAILYNLEKYLEVREGDLVSRKNMITKPTAKNMNLMKID